MDAKQQSILIRNARLFTPQGIVPAPAAVGIVGSIIAAVGREDQVRAALPSAAEVIDVGGRLVLPGFIDNHVHFLSGGKHLLGLDLGQARSPDEFAAAIRAHAAKMVPGEWITGGRWDNTRWPRGQWPHRRLIDAFTANLPVLVYRTDGHVGLANACALRVAGITAETPDPPGGAIERDANGELTGILRDAAMELVRRRVPEPDDAAKEKAVRAALRHAAKLGVTTVNDMDSPHVLPVYQRLLEAGELTCRITYWAGVAQWEHVAALNLPRGFGNEMLRLGGIKAFIDGSFGARTAWMFAPYLDQPGDAGLPAAAGLPSDRMTEGKLEGELLAIDRAGMALAVHAIGDRANAVMLDLVERMALENGPRDRRLRIEHAQHVRPQDVARFAKLKVIASVQPTHILLDAPQIIRALGPGRARESYPLRSFLDAGVRLTFGTDWPVVSLDPLLAIYAAVTRRPLDGSFPAGWVAEQRVTPLEAIRAYTINSAFAEFREQLLGSLEPGRGADVVVLSQDITAIEPAAIHEARVVLTVVAGRVVYCAEDF